MPTSKFRFGEIYWRDQFFRKVCVMILTLASDHSIHTFEVTDIDWFIYLFIDRSIDRLTEWLLGCLPGEQWIISFNGLETRVPLFALKLLGANVTVGVSVPTARHDHSHDFSGTLRVLFSDSSNLKSSFAITCRFTGTTRCLNKSYYRFRSLMVLQLFQSACGSTFR